MTVPQLTDDELSTWLSVLPEWEVVRDGKAIHRQLKFGDFAEAFAFMTRVAFIADKRDHHPEWSNVYDTLDITLTTHDADGLSVRDMNLAKEIDSLL